MKDAGRGPEGRFELETQGWIWDVLHKMPWLWTPLPGLCCGWLSIILNVDKVLSLAKANFLVWSLMQSLGQEPKTTAMTECPNVFGWHATSRGPVLCQRFSPEPSAGILLLGRFIRQWCGKNRTLTSSSWRVIDWYTTQDYWTRCSQSLGEKCLP